jgi:MerR family transcriptional regulator, mercuric resistance operon regulatory protein
MLIGDLSAATGVAARTIRYYEDRGLLPSPSRSAAGYRLYDEGDTRRLRFIRAAQVAGLTLAEIGGIISLRDEGIAPCRHTRQLLTTRRDEICTRIEELRRLEAQLATLIEVGNGVSPADCDPDRICSIIPAER